MSTVVNFRGKNYIEPGAYAVSVYNPTSVVNVSAYGNVMMIDTGLSTNGSYEFAGGSGIEGELNKGLKSVYEFTSYEDFLAFMGGGKAADIAQKIFKPADGVLGAPKLYYVRAAETTAADLVVTISSGNSLNLTCKNEGVAGNGVAPGSVLKVGYAAKVIAGITAGKYVLQISKGNFAGVDEAGEPYGAYSLSSAGPNIIAESPELGTLQELYDWAKADRNVLSHFVVSMTGAGATALTTVSQALASGGTTNYASATAFQNVLEAITELDVTFFLATKTGADATDATTNGALFTFLKTDAKFTEFMVVGGGDDDSDLFGTSGTSEAAAKYYNSGQVVIVHGAPVVPRKDKNGTKQLSSIYAAASVIGLAAGAAAQTPLTYKRIGYQAFAYDLKKKEREKALQLGILHFRNVNGYWCVNQGVTTLQDNKNTIAYDGQSFEFSIELIKAQINKELILDSESRFTGQTAAQASPVSFKNFTETKLSSFVAYPGNDNLIIGWRNVSVAAKNGDYFISYEFIPNVPVNKQFYVGNILDYTF